MVFNDFFHSASNSNINTTALSKSNKDFCFLIPKFLVKLEWVTTNYGRSIHVC